MLVFRRVCGDGWAVSLVFLLWGGAPMTAGRRLLPAQPSYLGPWCSRRPGGVRIN